MQRGIYFYFKAVVGIALLIFVVGYSLFQSRNLLHKPQITIEGPENGATLSENMLDIKGNVGRVNFVSLDDRPIFIDEAGNLSEKVLLSPGYNVFKIAVEDSFKRKAEKLLEVVYKPAT